VRVAWIGIGFDLISTLSWFALLLVIMWKDRHPCWLLLVSLMLAAGIIESVRHVAFAISKGMI